ncbi:glutathione synthase [Nitrosomonas sp. PY1]|uniref:glutathione synthase n=1 Tax=Nitrosomonas sp. PY1 TaxID=1803906 RepID=UPI001FC816EC|nr:glutathione synthase [Nitrosomonas sp. PY1]GKS69897.1 glutathione synthase [Nitrosomonas sp. PY1]
MKLAFIVDPLDSIKINKDSSYAMISEAISRGHAIYVLEQHDIALVDNQVISNARSLHLKSASQYNPQWYELGHAEKLSLTTFDAVLMRKDPPFDSEYVYSTYLLELAETQGALVINSPRGIRDHNEKLAIAKFPQFIAPTLVTSRTALIREFITIHRIAILKPLDSMGGTSIFQVSESDANLSVILEIMTQYETRTIMVQRYIPEITLGDKRILIIDGEAVPYALARVPKPGETRANLAAGGIGKTQPLSVRDQEIAAFIGPELVKNGLMFVGLDVIGDYLTEINVTSPTGIQEITKQSGFDAAAMIIDRIEAMVNKRKQANRHI